MTDRDPPSLIGVVLVHYGEPQATLRCLASVLQDPSRARRRVVIVDNSANLDPEELPSGVALLSCPDNPGFGRGANRGAGALLADLANDLDGLVVLNHDVILADGFLDASVAALRVGGTGAAGGPIFMDRIGGDLWSAGGGLNLLTGTVRQSRSRSRALRRRTVTFLPGAALALTVEAWKEVGGFSRRYFLYNEDLDLCLRLRRAGWRLLYDPDMACVHELGRATGSADRSPLYLEHLTATRLKPFSNPLYRFYLAVLHSAYVATRALCLVVRFGFGAGPRARALLRGHGRALRGFWRDTIERS